MILLSWNCDMAFRKKAALLAKYNADILVIQESENPNKFPVDVLKEYVYRIWVGDLNKKGLFIAAKSEYKIEKNPSHDKQYRYIIPVIVSGKAEFNLIAVWAQNYRSNNEYKYRYIGQVLLALQQYEHLLDEKSIVIGDFNSNKIWDKSHKGACHSDVVEFLKNKNIQSLYHIRTHEEQGQERENTFYLHKKLNKGFHIDYCFASANMQHNGFNIDDDKNWLIASDHLPLIIEFTDLK